MADKVTPIDGKQRRGGRKLRAEKMAELERDNAELRQRLEMQPRSLDDWETVGTQELRDSMAVRALIAEWNDPYRALIRLGFELPPRGSYTDAQRALIDSLLTRVFKTPGVEALLAAMTRDLEESKTDLIRRQTEIALHGDPDTSVRAFSQLSKIAGWQKTPDVAIDRRTVNLYTLVSGEAPRSPQQSGSEQEALPPAEIDGLGFLDYEPGAPVRIDSGDPTVHAALSEQPE